jgi:hypothetical protein
MNDGRYKWIGGGEPLDRGPARVRDAAPPEPAFHLWLDEPPARQADRAKVRDQAGPALPAAPRGAPVQPVAGGVEEEVFADRRSVRLTGRDAATGEPYEAALYLPRGGEGYESIGGAPAPRSLNQPEAADRARRANADRARRANANRAGDAALHNLEAARSGRSESEGLRRLQGMLDRHWNSRRPL